MALPGMLSTLDTTPADGTEFTSRGYYANDDGAHLTYRYNASSTATPDGVDADHPGLIHRPSSISGASPGRWIAQVTREEIKAVWFGVRADNTQDDAPYIQAAIDRAINISNTWPWGCHVVRLPNGNIKVGTTIHLGYGSNTYCTIHLVGSNLRASFFVWGTKLRPTFTNAPVVNFQGVRNSSISGIGFIGSLTAPASKSPYATWTGVFPDTQHQQFAGVSIDAFSGADPTGTTYTPPAGWSKYHSSDVLIEKCHMENISCGVILKPSGGTGADNNGDYIRISDCSITKCKYAFSINGSQTRGNRVQNCKIVDCYGAVGIGWYGRTLGRSTWIENSAIEGCNWIVKGKNTDWLGKIVIRNCFGEAISGCIDVASGGGNCNVEISNNDFATLIGSDATNEERYFVSTPSCGLVFENNRIVNEGTTRSSLLILAGSQTRVNNNLFVRQAASYGAPKFAVVPGANSSAIKIDVENNSATRFAELVPSQNAGIAGALGDQLTYIGSKQYTLRSPLLWTRATTNTIFAYKSTSNQSVLLFKVVAAAVSNFGTWTIEQINECDGTNPISSSDTIAKLGTSSLTYILRGREPMLSGPVS
jgi:hypothetical protein